MKFKIKIIYIFLIEHDATYCAHVKSLYFSDSHTNEKSTSYL
jgi:hypothetical protein